MEKTILIFNFPAEEEKELRRLARDDVRILPVPAGRFDVPLSGILEEGEAVGGSGKASEEPLRERMMVFAGFPGDEFDSLLASLKAGKVGVGALKAVLTPTNAGWTSRELYRELVREREAFFRMREDRKPWR